MALVGRAVATAQVSDLTCRIAIAFWQTNNDKIIPLFKLAAEGRQTMRSAVCGIIQTDVNEERIDMSVARSTAKCIH